ncbi:MAG: YIP1 family protein [Anaerobacillus sp.]|uniref:YIP1 family protein n=1 Tax=Anaerobacillus sp. TaxID=1872506 RepID=UPI00391B715A
MSELHEKSEEISVKPGKPSVFGVLLNPSEQFDKLKANPLVLVPLLLVTVLYTIAMGITAFGMDSTWLLAQLGPEEVEIFAELEMFMRITMLITGLFMPVFGALIFAVIYIIIAKISKSVVTFKQLFSLAVFVSVIGGVGVLFNAIMTTLLGTNPDIPFTSLAILFDTENVNSLFLSIEVFSIWQLIVTVIGLRKVANFSAALAWIVTIVFYFFSIFLALLIG